MHWRMSAFDSNPIGSAAPPTAGARRRLGLPLRWHLAALSAALTIPLLALAGLEMSDTIGARRAEAALEMSLQLARTTQGVAQGLAAMTANAQRLGSSHALATRDLTAFRFDAEDVAKTYGVDVVLRDSNGAQRVATRVPRDAPLPLLPQEDPAGRAAVERGESFVSDIYGSGMTHPYLVRIIVPAVIGAGSTADHGCLVEVAVPPSLISSWLDATALPPHWVVEIVGRNGIVISHNGDADRYAGRGSANSVFGTKHDPGAWSSQDLNGEKLTGRFARLPNGWLVATGAPDSVLAAPIRLTWVRLGFSAALLIIGGLTVSLLLTRRIGRSAAELEAAARAIGHGEQATPVYLSVRELAFVQDALITAGQDLAYQRRTEQTLMLQISDARDLLQAVVDGSADIIIARNSADRVVLANLACARLIGQVSGNDVVALDLAETQPDARTAALRALAFSPLSTATVEGRAFEIGHSPLRDQSGVIVGTISIARDVTDRLGAEIRLQRVQADLARAGRLSAVAAMSAGLAHELHQPLSAAANFLAVAMRKLSTSSSQPPLILEALSEASAQVLRTGEIVQRLRRFIGSPDMAPAPLSPLVEEAAEAAWRHSSPAAAQLHFQLDPALTALVDPVSIQQVVSNLVRNAADALGGRGGDVWVTLAASADGGSVVSVLDSGHGIDPSDADRLFDVFSASAKKDGLGVGLAICRTIVAAHGGWITATNHSAGGAAFVFTLPPSPVSLTDGLEKRDAA